MHTTTCSPSPSHPTQVGTSATIGASAAFVGTLMAAGSISASAGATVTGQLLAINGGVTLYATPVTIPPLCYRSLTRPLLPIALGAASAFAITAGSSVASVGGTVVSGSVGVYPGSSDDPVSGFPPARLTNGIIVVGNASAAALAAVHVAYDVAAGLPSTASIFGGDVGGLTLAAGVYTCAAALAISGTVTLAGDADSVFVFQVGASLTSASHSSVALAGGVLPSHVFWQVRPRAGDAMLPAVSMRSIAPCI